MNVCKRRNTTSENNLNRFLPVWNPISSLFPSNHMVLIPDLRRGLWESEAIITGLQSEIHTTENQQKTSVWKNKINIYWTYCLFFVLSGLDVVGDSKKKALLLQRLQGDLSCLGGPSHCLKVKGSAEKDRGGNQGRIDFSKHLTSYSLKNPQNLWNIFNFLQLFSRRRCGVKMVNLNPHLVACFFGCGVQTLQCRCLLCRRHLAWHSIKGKL